MLTSADCRPAPIDLTDGRCPLPLPSRLPARPPAAAPTSALVHTFRSLLIESSKALRPRNRPAPNPAPMPTIVHSTRFDPEPALVFDGGAVRSPVSATSGVVDRVKPIRPIQQAFRNIPVSSEGALLGKA